MVLIAASGLAQQPPPGILDKGGGRDDRGSVRIRYWNRDANASAGGFAIDYGRPVWKKDYQDPAQRDAMTKGKAWRMGSPYWAVLDTGLPLKIAGKDVDTGSYFLALRRTMEGSEWRLIFFDPPHGRGTRLDLFEINKSPAQFETPMRVEKTDSRVEKLTVTLSHAQQDIKSVTMKVAWGNLALRTLIKVRLAT